MAIFLSIYTNKIDDKNRASVPAQFRNIIESKGENIIYAYPSLINQCLEVCTLERVNYLSAHIETFDLFSEEREALSTAILSGCEAMQIDAKGRVCLSERLVRFAELDNDIAFVGKGHTFEIWNKNRFEAYFANAREIAKNKTLFQKRGELAGGNPT
jgi:MraZ protein